MDRSGVRVGKTALWVAGYIECLSICALSFNGGKAMGKTLGKRHRTLTLGSFPSISLLPSIVHCRLFIDVFLATGDGVDWGGSWVCVCVV